MTTKTQKLSLTKLEKQFIIAYYHSVADTLNFSRLEDVARNMKDVSIEQAKGVLGSLVNKGVINPNADTYNMNDEKYPTMGLTDLLSTEDLNEIAKDFGYCFDFEDMDYDYLKPLKKTSKTK